MNSKSSLAHRIQPVLVLERETGYLKRIPSLADLAVRADNPEASATVLHDLTERHAA